MTDGTEPARGKSGYLSLKLPITLHTRLAEVAQRENVSVNYLITFLLAASLGSKFLSGIAGDTPRKEVVAAT